MKPICACCRKPYGQRRTEDMRIEWMDGEPMPKPATNKRVVRKGLVHCTNVPEQIKMYETMANSIRKEIREQAVHALAMLRTKPSEKMYSCEVQLWDGESYYTPYKPFCTLRCALAYAIAAHEHRQERRKAAL